MSKQIVIVGPNLPVWDQANYIHLLDTSICIIGFPEHNMGAQAVRDFVTDRVRKGFWTNYVTRYDSVLCALGECVDLGYLLPNEVAIHLWYEDKWTIHHFTQSGVLASGWPFGCLT